MRAFVLGVTVLFVRAAAFGTPSVTWTQQPLGSDKTVYTITLNDSTSFPGAWAANLIFFTSPIGLINQPQPFSSPVFFEGDANALDGTNGYLKSEDSWVKNGFYPSYCDPLPGYQLTDETPLQEAPNFFQVHVITAPGQGYGSIELAQIVTNNSQLYFEGAISRNGMDYQVWDQLPRPMCIGFGQLKGDVNRDGLVSDADYTIWADNYLEMGSFIDGDLNGDAFVTDADYTLWADAYGAVRPRFYEQLLTTPLVSGWPPPNPYNPAFHGEDYNMDMMSTDADYTIWADNYGYGVTGDVVPEPATLGLLAAGLAGLLRRRQA